MIRTRRVTIAAMLLLSVLVTGCGEDTQGPTPTRSVGLGRPASEQAQPSNTLLDRVFEGYSAPTSSLQQIAPLSSIRASYGAVPGASSVSDADTLSYTSDDPFERIDEISSEYGNDLLDTSTDYAAGLDATDIGDTEFDSDFETDYDAELALDGIEPNARIWPS